MDKCPDGIILLEEDDIFRPKVEGDETDSPPVPKTQCIIDKSIFEVHREYRDLGTDVSLYRSDSGNILILIFLACSNIQIHSTHSKFK